MAISRNKRVTCLVPNLSKGSYIFYAVMNDADVPHFHNTIQNVTLGMILSRPVLLQTQINWPTNVPNSFQRVICSNK